MLELQKVIEDIAEGAQEQISAVADAMAAVKGMNLADRASKSTKEIADLIRDVESHSADAAQCVRSTFEEAAASLMKIAGTLRISVGRFKTGA